MIKLLKQPLLWLLMILCLAFVVRLYKIDNPIADWHSWRQADTAAVARNFYKEGFNMFYPKGDDISQISETGKFNPLRLRYVEFPIYSALVYFAYVLNGGVNELLARLVSVSFSLGSIVILFFLTKRYFGNATALLSALLFAILPFSIYYSRVILPEPSLVFFGLGMVYFCDRWIFEGTKKLFIVAALFTILAFLTKPTVIFYTPPLFYSFYLKEKKFFPISKKYLGFVGLVLTPLLIWRLWINLHPEGIPSSAWLLNGNNIRFRPAFWRWIIGDRFNRELLSPVGVFLFILGLIIKPLKAENLFLYIYALGAFLYLIVFATGNVQHDYYQALIVPAICIFTARGLWLMLKGLPLFHPRIVTIPLAILLFTLMIGLTWYEIKGLYQINNPIIVEVGRRADTLLPKNAVVIAPYNGDTAFLYQINRIGFPVVAASFEDLIKDFGVTHFVSTNYDKDTATVLKKYKVIEQTPKYVIADLRYPSSTSGALIK